MCALFTGDDIGKIVETDDGEEVGVVAAIDGAEARVSPIPTSAGSDPFTPSVADEADETRPIESTFVREITDDRVVLTDDYSVPTETGETGAADSDDQTAGTEADVPDDLEEERAAARGASADPDALTERAPEAELSPEDVDRRSDATVSADGESRRTDAAVDPDDDARRGDGERESDES